VADVAAARVVRVRDFGEAWLFLLQIAGDEARRSFTGPDIPEATHPSRLPVFGEGKTQNIPLAVRRAPAPHTFMVEQTY